MKECNGDCCAVAHAFSLGDLASRFADITPLAEALDYIASLAPPSAATSKL